MSHSQSHKRSRDDRTASSSFYKDYHSAGDSHSSKQRRSDVGSSSRGGSSHYPTSYSGDSKKYHGHQNSSGPSSQYHSYSSSLSHHHRQQYEKPSGSNHYNNSSSRYYKSEGTGASNTSRHEHHSSSSGRVFRKPMRMDQRKPYVRASGGVSGVRRIPPPLSPPPLMKISTSSSRYRQAPPEDRHHLHQKATRKFSTPTKVYREQALAEKKNRKASSDVEDKPKAIKRTSSSHDSSDDKKPIKKIKGETDDKTVNGSDDTNEKKEEGETEDKDGQDEKCEDEKDKVEENEEEVETGTRSGNKPLLKLHCSYCDFRCVSYKDFTAHTRSFPHAKVMSAVVEANRKRLLTLKEDLRDQQKDLEKTKDDQNTLSDTTSYCRVCELNLRTDPKEHEANEIHNEIKGLIHRRCDVCDVDFRLWRVYIFHTVSLEHVKRVAMKDMKEKEELGTCIKGTNMSAEEIGMDLLEEQTVIFCKACVRYFPMREGEFEESRLRHCLTLNHASLVEEYNNRMNYLAKRDADEKAREERKRMKKERMEQEAKDKQKKEETSNSINENSKVDTSEETEDTAAVKNNEDKKDDNVEESENEIGENNTSKDDEVDTGRHDESVETEEAEDEEPDEDEIQLHADDDEVDAPLQEDD